MHEMTTELFNIPSITPSEFVEIYTEMICEAIRQGSISGIRTPMLWGPPGVGKSTIVLEIRSKVARTTGKKVDIHVIHLMLRNPEDLIGLPIIDRQRMITRNCRPSMFDLDPSDDVLNVMLLDEFSVCRPSVRTAVYQLILEHRIGEFSLPENTIIMAAGNRKEDDQSVFRMDSPLASRMAHYAIKTDPVSWLKWAKNADLDPRIISFIQQDETRLIQEADLDTLAYANPRTWEAVSNHLRFAANLSEEQRMKMFGALIGNDMAVELMEYLKVMDSIPDVRDIAAGIACSYPRKADQLYAVTNGLIAFVNNHATELSIRELENVERYVSRLPQEYIELYKQETAENEIVLGYRKNNRNRACG